MSTLESDSGMMIGFLADSPFLYPMLTSSLWGVRINSSPTTVKVRGFLEPLRESLPPFPLPPTRAGRPGIIVFDDHS